MNFSHNTFYGNLVLMFSNFVLLCQKKGKPYIIFCGGELGEGFGGAFSGVGVGAVRLSSSPQANLSGQLEVVSTAAAEPMETAWKH